MKKTSPAAKSAVLMKAAQPARKSRYKSYPVRITVVKQKGRCGMGHKVGDAWMYNFEPGKPSLPPICEVALHTMFGRGRVEMAFPDENQLALTSSGTYTPTPCRF